MLLITSLMLFCSKSNHLAEDGRHACCRHDRCMVHGAGAEAGNSGRVAERLDKGTEGGHRVRERQQPRSDIPFGNGGTRRYAITIGGYPGPPLKE